MQLKRANKGSLADHMLHKRVQIPCCNLAMFILLLPQDGDDPTRLRKDINTDVFSCSFKIRLRVYLPLTLLCTHRREARPTIHEPTAAGENAATSDSCQHPSVLHLSSYSHVMNVVKATQSTLPYWKDNNKRLDSVICVQNTASQQH